MHRSRAKAVKLGSWAYGLLLGEYEGTSWSVTSGGPDGCSSPCKRDSRASNIPFANEESGLGSFVCVCLPSNPTCGGFPLSASLSRSTHHGVTSSLTAELARAEWQAACNTCMARPSMKFSTESCKVLLTNNPTTRTLATPTTTHSVDV